MTDIITGTLHDGGANELYRCWAESTALVTDSGESLMVAAIADSHGDATDGFSAQLAVNTALGSLKNSGGGDIAALLQEAVRAAGRAVYGLGQQAGGAQCSLALAVIHDERQLYIASVGRERIYLCRDEGLTQLNNGRQQKQTLLGPDQNVRADTGFYFGVNSDPEVAHARGSKGLAIEPGDTVILCSDGLLQPSPYSGEPCISRQEIVALLARRQGDRAAREIIETASDRGAADHISIALLQTIDPERVAAGSRPLLLLGALLLLLLLGAGAIFGISQLRGNPLQTASAAAPTELPATPTDDVAPLVAELATNDADLVLAPIASESTATTELFSVQATEAAVAAAATADALQIQAAELSARATQDAFGLLTQEAMAATLNAEVLCMRQDGYLFTIDGPQYDPPLGTTVEVGEQPPLQISWQVTNRGECPLRAPYLRSVRDGSEQLLTLLQDDSEIDALPPAEEAQLIVTLDADADLQNLDEEWFLVTVEGSDQPLSLFDQPHFALAPSESWLVVLLPTATPSRPRTSSSSIIRPTATSSPDWFATQQVQNAAATSQAQATATRAAAAANWQATQTVQSRATGQAWVLTATAQAPAPTPTVPAATNTPFPTPTPFPTATTVGDRDGDGVPDNLDYCPDDAFATVTGCPVSGGGGEDECLPGEKKGVDC